VCRAWDITKPFIVAPAMNTLMWDHPFTKKQLAILQNELMVHVIPPVSKVLACNEVGNGALAHPLTIVETLDKVVMMNTKLISTSRQQQQQQQQQLQQSSNSNAMQQ